jgi:hypothetical protein
MSRCLVRALSASARETRVSSALIVILYSPRSKRHCGSAMLARFAFVLLVALLLAACKSSPKSSATIHSGDGPSIHYHEPQAAGGTVKTTRYR